MKGVVLEGGSVCSLLGRSTKVIGRCVWQGAAVSPNANSPHHKRFFPLSFGFLRMLAKFWVLSLRCLIFFVNNKKNRAPFVYFFAASHSTSALQHH